MGAGTTNSKTIWTNYYYDGAASNQKYWAVVRSNLLHSSLSRCTVFAAVPFFTSHRKLCNYAELKTNHFPEPNQTPPCFFTFLHPIFTCLESHTEHRWLEMMMLLRPPPTLRNIFLTSKFLVTNFLTIKTQPGTASKAKAGARLLIANHLDQSNYLVKSETRESSQ